MPHLDRRSAVFVLNLGEDENRMNPTWAAEIEGLLDEVEQANGPKALVTTSTGKFWSNGLDLAWVDGDTARLGQVIAAAAAVFGRVLTLALPTVAAIGGHVYAGGGLLALAHDYRIMRADRGYFCMPEIDLRMAFTPGMNALLVAKLQPNVARDVMITGRRYGGTEAQAEAIVDAAVHSDEVLPRALALAGDLAAKADPIMGTIKRGMYGEAADGLRPRLAPR